MPLIIYSMCCVHVYVCMTQLALIIKQFATVTVYVVESAP